MIEKDIVLGFSMDLVIGEFEKMKERRPQFRCPDLVDKVDFVFCIGNFFL